MTLKIEDPAAADTAHGAKIENIETPKMYEIPTGAASLNRLRELHLARLLGVTDNAAATIAALAFAGGAQ